MTQKPFGVNLTILPTQNPPDYKAYARIVVEEGVKIVETAGRLQEVLEILKTGGCVVIHKCTSIKHAKKAESLGVDFISIDGFEAAGHIGETDIPGLVLIRRAAMELKIPFLASGGMSDGYTLAAAIALGACGMNCGTRFMATVEAPMHMDIKKKLVAADENSTILVMRRWNNTARLFRNSVSEEVAKIERESSTGDFSEVYPLMSGARGKKVYETGDPEFGIWWAGVSAGLIKDIPTCEELLKRIEKQYAERVKHMASLLQAKL